MGPAGVTIAGAADHRGLNTGDRLLTIFPTTVIWFGGTSCRTGGCARRYEMIAVRSESLSSPNCINSCTDALPSGRTVYRSIRAICESV